MINEINMLGALVRGELPECNMKEAQEKEPETEQIEELEE